MENQNSAVAVRKEEAMMNQLKKSVDLVIPSSVQDRELFAQNCMLYLAEVNAIINGEFVEIPKKDKDEILAKVPILDFLQVMWNASKRGLNFGCREFSLIPFGGKSQKVSLVVDYRVDRRMIESKNITIEFLHGKESDIVYEFPNPLKHEFPTRNEKRPMTFKTIEGKGYTAKTTNDVVWYACIARHNETGEELSYVESAANIRLRANPSTFNFYINPNAQDTMYEKFVLRQLAQRLPTEWGGEDWDKVSNIPFEDAEYEEVAEAPTPKEVKEVKESKPKTPPKQELKPLVEGSETWFKMIDSIKSHKVTIDQVARYYDIDPIRAQIKKLFDTYKETPEANEKGGETEENPLNINL
jgi:hypothetical protein